MNKLIYKALTLQFPEWDDTKLKESICSTISLIIHFSQKDEKSFADFLIWQQNLPYCKGISSKLLPNLLEIAHVYMSKEPNKYSVVYLSKVLQSDLPDPHTYRETLHGSADIFSFHSRLFGEVDPYVDESRRDEVCSDLNFMVKNLRKSIEQNDPIHFLLSIHWQMNLLEVLGHQSLSLTRLLVSIQVFNREKTQSSTIAEAIKLLTDPSDRLINNVKEEEYAAHIADLHIGLFEHIDQFSTYEHRDKIIYDAEKHLQFLYQAAQAKSDVLFTEYVVWVYSTLSAIGLPGISIFRFFITIRVVIKTHNPVTIKILDKGSRKLLRSINGAKGDVEPSFITNNEAQRYLQLLLKGDRDKATSFILDLAEGEMEVEDIYMSIFQPVQYEIGRLWEMNKVSVSQEHFCTATTQLIMSILYPKIVHQTSIDKNIVTTCVGSELHELGVRMITDFLEMKGWNTHYLGANVPVDTIVDAIKDIDADIIALSVTLTPHIQKARDIISYVKQHYPSIKILLGGYPFLQDPDLCHKIGGDKIAKSAREVHKIAMELIS